ncbi:MAG: alpha/beta hydrolase [Planctomycetes bacterium]|nr:alpha/beta hydrolase [Planctomycetota bacterium]
MGCRLAHDVPRELEALPPRPELHALAMPRHGRGEIHDVLLEGQRLPGLRLLRIYVPAPEFRGEAPLPVLLLNDGHKAFEPANHRQVPAFHQSGTLQFHRVMDGLLCTGTLPPAVVCAVATHAGSRADQYVPVRTRFGDTEFGGGGDAYLELLEHEVLPAMAARLRGLTLATTAAQRILVGTSIGGIAALYGALTRPQVFGGAIALSPSAWVGDGFLTRLAQANGAVGARIAADIGDGERAPIRDHCRQLFTVLAERGAGRVLADEVPGRHHEDSWRQRLPRLLQHVLGGQPAPPPAPPGA